MTAYIVCVLVTASKVYLKNSFHAQAIYLLERFSSELEINGLVRFTNLHEVYLGQERTCNPQVSCSLNRNDRYLRTKVFAIYKNHLEKGKTALPFVFLGKKTRGLKTLNVFMTLFFLTYS